MKTFKKLQKRYISGICLICYLFMSCVNLQVGGTSFEEDGYTYKIWGDDFESYSINENVTTNHFSHQPANGKVIQDSDSAHGHVLMIPVKSPSGTTTLRNRYDIVTQQFPSGSYNQLYQAKLALDIKWNERNNAAVDTLSYTSNDIETLFDFTVAGKITYRDYRYSTDFIEYGEYDANTWYSFTVYLDASSSSYTAYMNGDLIVENGKYSQAESKNGLRAFGAYIKSGGAGREMYFDNFGLWTVDSNPLHVKEASLENGTDDVSVGALIEFTMSKSIGEYSDINIIKKSGEEVTGFSTSVNGENISIAFSRMLDFNTEYVVTFGTGIRDIYGRNLTVPYSLVFTTMNQALSAATPRFENEHGEPIEVLPQTGTVTAVTSVFNPYDVDKDALLYIGLYDLDGKYISGESTEVIIPANDTELVYVSLTQGDYTDCTVKAFVLDNINDKNLLSGTFSSLSADGYSAAWQKGNGLSSITQGEVRLNEDVLSISGTLAPVAQRSIIISVTDAKGQIDMLTPVVTDATGSYFLMHRLSGAQGTYGVSISGRMLSNTYNQEVFYTSADTREQILSDINVAGSVNAIKELLQENQKMLNIDDKLMNTHAYQVLFEQRPINSFEAIRDTLVIAKELLESLNSTDWSSLSSFIDNNTKFLLNGTTFEREYLNLPPGERNRINMKLVDYIPFSGFKAFRTAFTSEMESYEKPSSTGGTDNLSGSRSPIGGRGSSGGINYIVPLEQNVIFIPEPPQIAEPFIDLDDAEWATDSIWWLYEKGIISSDENKHFRPLDNITREEFVKLLAETFDMEGNDVPEFTDADPNAWYVPYLTAMKSHEIVMGYPDGSFGIGETISRQDMAVIIYRTAVKFEKELPQLHAYSEFTDNDEISSYALEAVYNMKQAGILEGVGNGRFAPNASANRAEAAKVIYNLLYVIGEGWE